MSESRKHISKRDLMIRVICGILAFLMVGSIAYYTLAFLIFN
jgi:hypothetical protein